jgi:hypothetical protein
VVSCPKTSETIKWSIHEDKFEIHQGLCVKFALHDIIAHCLTVVHKIDSQVSDNDQKKLQSYKQVLPRTLLIQLMGVWEQVVAEMDQEEDESLATFTKTLKPFFRCKTLKPFFRCHSTEDDQHELVSTIRSYFCVQEHENFPNENRQGSAKA